MWRIPFWMAADAIMLQCGDFCGAYPIDAVKTMARIAKETEAHGLMLRRPHCIEHPCAHAVSHAARALSERGERSGHCRIIHT